VYIDIPQKVILQRMEVMQIDRIIGMNKRIKTGMDKKEALKQVLDERAMAYENCYDYKFHTD
jgi:shikimate kinase